MSKGRKIIRVFLSIFISGAVTALIIFILIKLTPVPPSDDIESAIKELSNASSRQASIYARKLFHEAETAFDSAMVAWRRENSRFIFFRNYDRVYEYAQLARKKAREATLSSERNSHDMESHLSEKIKSLELLKKDVDRLFSKYPLPDEDRARLSKGKLLLKESEIAYEKRQLLQANRKINDAEYLLTSVYNNAMEDIKAYFGSFPAWKKWFDSSIAESRRNKTYLIVVDKYAHKCYLYQNGVKKYEFDAEFGKNWVGDKRKMGDRATPEGIYKIVRKYQGKETPYYKSLAINYPNEEDIERFNKAIAKGLLSPSSKIGGGIEIHGNGGKSADWTEGCIALKNKDIDILFPLVKTGTSVVIVGSLRSLKDIMQEETDGK